MPFDDLPDPPVVVQDQNSYVWRHWYQELHDYLTGIGRIAWSVLDFTNSNITDIEKREHNNLQTLQGGSLNERYHLTQAQHTLLTSLPTLDSGTYTPTLTNVTNVTSSTAYQCQYMQVGSVVTVSGLLEVTPTAGASATELGISLPVASNFGANEDCGGSGESDEGYNIGMAIRADATNNRAAMVWKTEVATASRNVYFSFTYRII